MTRRTRKNIRSVTRAFIARMKFLAVATIAVLLLMQTSTAFTSDLETTTDNIFQATTLDVSLRSLTTDFDPTTDLLPGDSSERQIFVQKIGALPFQYSQAYQYASGDTNLCQALNLTVDYQYYDTGGTLQTVNKYNGALSSFSLNTSGSDAELELPNSHGYFANSDYADNEHWFVYTVTLPNGADPALENLTCSFNIVARAWQLDFTAYPQGFHDEEILLNNHINSGMWYLEAPVNEGWNIPTTSATPNEQPLDLSCGAITNGGNPAAPRIAQNWSAVVGASRYQREVTFPNGSVSSGFYETNNYTPFSSFGSSAGTPGLWRTRVRAFIDNNSNNVADAGDLISNWSNYCNVTLDTTAPVTTATITNSPVRPVEERITNGGFESNLDGWTTGGQVQVVTGSDGSYASPKSGSKMAKVGHDTDPGNDVSVNILSQAIPKGIRSVGFYYNFVTTDSDFDEPGMMVYINNQQVQQIWANDVNTTGIANGTAHSTGWQHMNIYVGDVEEATLTIAFYSGNTGDSNNQSWLYVDDVSTLDLAVNGQALFELHPNESATTYYQLGTTGPIQAGTSFTVSSQPTDGVIKYWSVDQAGNTEAQHLFYISFDDEAPTPISELNVTDDGGGEYTLTFLAPSDDLYPAVSEYDIRYSTSEITSGTDWNGLDKPTRVNNDGLPGTIRAPRKAGEAETIVLGGLTAGQQYYFAIKSADAAKNWSAISDIASVNVGSTTSTGVVLNEILYDPVGSDDSSMPSGEWVELFNNSATDVDANGWVITDMAANSITISSSNSDNNLNLSDGGETVVPAGGRLVIYVNGAGIFDNTGDTVTLNNGLIDLDTRSYLGGKAEGNSEARIPDGVGAWVDPVATPGTPNAANLSDLSPQVKLWQQDANNAKFTIFDGQAFTTADYVVMYTHLVDGGEVREGLQGNVGIADQSRINVNDVYFGTCSEGGEVCVPHTDVTLVGVEVELSKPDGTTKVLQYDYPNTWSP